MLQIFWMQSLKVGNDFYAPFLPLITNKNLANNARTLM